MDSAEFLNQVESAIHANFLCRPQSGLLTHEELHSDGSTSSFSIKPSCKMVAFSIDQRGQNPFPVLNLEIKGLSAKNDLTIICENKGKVYVFVLEYKNSANPGRAQHQIECGIAFCEYLFKLLRVCYGVGVVPHFFGVAAYRPQKGKTNPRIKFAKTGLNGVLRADWLIENVLPLSELVRAAEQSLA